MEDYCDGTLLKSHPLYAAHCEDEVESCINLQFIIYFDEVETNNPIGASKGKHKLGMHK